MADAPRSSFIPKQVSQGATPSRVRRRRIFNNISFFGALFLGVALLLSAGTFGYKYLVEKRLDDSRQLLATEQDKFSASDLNVISSLNQHIDAARFLLDRHTAPSKVFLALEESTKESIQYTEFLLKRHASGNVTVTLKGATDAFGKIALQNLQYVEEDILKGAVVTGIAYAVDSEEGESVSNDQIIFNVSTSVPIADVGYTGTPAVAEVAPVEEIEVVSDEVLEEGSDADSTSETEASTESSSTESEVPAETTVTEEESL